MSLTFSNISCAQNSCIPQTIQSVWLDPGARTQLQGRTSQGLFSGHASVPAWLTSTFLSFLLHPKQGDCIQAAYREQSWYVVWPIRCPGGKPNPRWLMVQTGVWSSFLASFYVQRRCDQWDFLLQCSSFAFLCSHRSRSPLPRPTRQCPPRLCIELGARSKALWKNLAL